MSEIFNSNDFDFFLGLIREAGDIGIGIQNKNIDVQIKDDNSIVTQADLQIQDFLMNSIRERYDNINFIHEEEFEGGDTDIGEDTISVIIDPIDGTAMFSMYLPVWCISIGIFKGYAPLYGFVYAPGAKMLFHNDDQLAYLNNAPLSVDGNRAVTSEANIFYATEIFRHMTIDFPGKIRNIGSTALQACLTADNKRNRTIAFIGKAFLWDWAGAIPIVLKAQGKVAYVNGDDVDYKEIFSSGYKMMDYTIAYSCDLLSDVLQFVTITD